MGAGTKNGLLPLVVIVGLAVVFINPVREAATDLWTQVVGGGEGVIVGAGDTQLLVSPSEKSRIENCGPERVIREKTCDDVKVVIMDAARMPFITRNISLAWADGHPPILTKDSTREAANRKMACPRSFVRKFAGSCDEYPFAATRQGGQGARTEEVPRRENNCQGGTLSTAYRYQNIADGDDYLLVIASPASIAQSAYAGVDIAKDQGCGI